MKECLIISDVKCFTGQRRFGEGGCEAGFVSETGSFIGALSGEVIS